MSGGGTVITRDSLQRYRPVWERCIEIETNTRYKTLLDRTSSKITAVEDARRRSLRPVDRLHRYIACGLQRVLLWCAVVKEILLLLLLLLMLPELCQETMPTAKQFVDVYSLPISTFINYNVWTMTRLVGNQSSTVVEDVDQCMFIQ